MKRNCLQCKKEFKGYQGNPNKYCSNSCQAKFNWAKPGYRQHMSDVHKGQVSGSKGKHWHCKGDGHKGKKSSYGMLGKKHSEETCLKMSKSKKGIVPLNVLRGDFKGEKNCKWKGGITSENRKIRGSVDWKQWRIEVFSRDKYTCQECGDCGVYIEPHHIIPVRSDRSKVFLINNGITLCRPCHQKTIWKESNFAEKYSALVAAQ